MANTVLSCPHCGSALTFGTEIRAGTPIECLICMQSFTAQPNETPIEMQSAAKATAPAMGIAVAEKPKATPPPIPTASKTKTSRMRRLDEASPAGKLGLVILGLGAMLLLITGVGLGLWLRANSARQADSNIDEMNDETSGQSGFATKISDLDKAKPPVVNDDDEDDARRKKKAAKLLLARKNAKKPIGNDLEFDPISTLKATTSSVAGLDQDKINAAIDKGVWYLKKTQHPNGAWHHGHEVGYAAIGGLTLLESGLASSDVAVQRAAAFVRAKAAENTQTYEISLAVLFLDRLGDPRDRSMIQWLSLRILAGQNDSGGWAYNCPVPPPQELYKLYAFLQSHRPALQNPLSVEGNTPLRDPLMAQPNNASAPFQQFNKMILTQQMGNGANTLPPKKGAVAPPTPKGKAKAPQPISPMLLMPDLRNIPVVQNQGKKKGQQFLRAGGGDNSNTQFALLALWTARRHGIPTDAALVFSYQRFLVSQSPDGGWGYTHTIGNSTPSMTCVGLLGEAMGHGAAPDVIGFNPKNPKEPIIKPILEDAAIKKGLTKLSEQIGEPSKDGTRKSYPTQNLYFLWSVERVAMLYDLKTINGKDWYGWGAQTLVYNQQMDGAWIHGQFHGESPAVNTCFALLFLRRSNLVQDLTNHIRLHSVIRDPG